MVQISDEGKYQQTWQFFGNSSKFSLLNIAIANEALGIVSSMFNLSQCQFVNIFNLHYGYIKILKFNLSLCMDEKLN